MNFYWFIFGCILGSFLNVFVSRSLAKTNFITGRSSCDNCQTKLTWYELIPIISYLIQFGKCRNCKAKIPSYVFIFELTMGLAFLESSPFTIFSTLALIFIIIVQIISTFDLLTFQFNASWLLPLIMVSLCLTQFSLLQLLIIFSIYAGLLSINYRYVFLGNGDLDLFFLILIAFGITNAIHTILIASLLALGYAFIKQQKLIPFIPFLYISFLIINSSLLDCLEI